MTTGYETIDNALKWTTSSLTSAGKWAGVISENETIKEKTWWENHSKKIIIGAVAGLGAYGLTKIGYEMVQRYKEQKLKGKIALVTGAGGRLPKSLGRLTALKLAREGATVVVVDIDTKGIQEVVNMITKENGKAIGYNCDITSYQNVMEMAEKVKKDLGDVDILVNNAGIVQGKSILEADVGKIEATFKVNTLAHFWTVKAFLPGMIKKGYGQVINIASVAGIAGASCMTDYSASKFACMGFHESLLAEAYHKNYPIDCTVVCPYYIDTGMFTNIPRVWGILTLLDADYVANRIVRAIKRKEIMVVIPDELRPMNWLWRTVWPDSLIVKMGVKSGISTSMENFGGHAAPPPSPAPK